VIRYDVNAMRCDLHLISHTDGLLSCRKFGFNNTIAVMIDKNMAVLAKMWIKIIVERHGNAIRVRHNKTASAVHAPAVDISWVNRCCVSD